MPFGLRARRQQQQQQQRQPQTSTTTKALRLKVPEDAVPGEIFNATVGGQTRKVSCPRDARPGGNIYVIVPKDVRESVLTNTLSTGTPHVYFVAVPDTVAEGQDFSITIEGRLLQAERPVGAAPGTILKVVIPPPQPQVPQLLHAVTRSSSSRSMGLDFGDSDPRLLSKGSTNDANVIVLTVPEGTLPGEKFPTTLEMGVSIQIVCPEDAYPGSTIRVNIGHQMLKYGKEGWARTLQIRDMTFRWSRIDDSGRVEDTSSMNFDFDVVKNAAFVRKLEVTYEASQYLNRSEGTLSLVPTEETSVTSLIHNDEASHNNSLSSISSGGPPKKFLLTWKETTKVQKRTFPEKAAWFRATCNRKFRIPWTEGYVSLDIRRGAYSLGDSVDIVMSLSPEDMRKSWRVTFAGEDGIDGGGLMRDWFRIITEEIMDPNKGLWQPSASNQMCMEINPASGAFCENHLMYFRFFGRILGRAIFDNQLISGHMVEYLYKHILGWPVTFGDLKVVDEVYHNSLMQLDDMAKEGTDVSVLCQDFTTTQDVFGSKQTVELVEGGENIAVTNANVYEYIEACLKHRLLDGVKPQLNELLLGFYDVIPEPMMAVFDFQELELLMCGLPQIDMDDWMLNTKYTGEFKGIGVFHPTCEWFWEILREEFDQEMKARTLQFVTATAGVPAHGFSALQSNEGAIRRFTIHGVAAGVYLYPRAHTCFNQIDLPIYNTKEELRERLTEAVVTGSGSFTLS